MAVVDQLLSVRQVEERIARTEDPRQRAMLGTVAAHLRAEAAGDLDGLQATLSTTPTTTSGPMATTTGPRAWTRCSATTATSSR